METQSDWMSLPKFTARQFVPEHADLTDKDQIVKLLEALHSKPLKTRDDLRAWLRHRSELDAALDQQGSILYIRMTCQTDDPNRAQAYQKFIEEVVPAVKPWDDRLNKKYLEASDRIGLEESHRIYDRSIRTDVELFEEKNVPLQTKVQLLSQEYQTLCGAMMVDFDGKERTLPEMGKFLLEPERSVRERAFYATAQRRLKDKEKLDELFDAMLELRNQIAINKGFANFRDYQFKAYHRFDYTPQDCYQYHATVEKVVVPLYRDIMLKRKAKLKVSSLRPWDTSVDPMGRKPLKPFEKVDQLVEGVRTIFDRLNPELGRQFEMMRTNGLLDLASRKGKAPGGYQSTLAEARKPFIFMNSVGVDGDVWTLLHEGGHAFHALASAHHELYSYRHAPMEFNEVASMAMELMGAEYIDVFYTAEEVQRSRAAHLADIISVLTWVAQVDAFQHWLYENPRHTHQERANQWISLSERFGSGVTEWSGLEEIRASAWHKQLHIFEVPFYYIEYGIAQLGALQLWLNFRNDKHAALQSYRQGLTLGGSCPLPDLYRAAGIKFDFSESTIAPLVAAVKQELDKID